MRKRLFILCTLLLAAVLQAAAQSDDSDIEVNDSTSTGWGGGSGGGLNPQAPDSHWADFSPLLYSRSMTVYIKLYHSTTGADLTATELSDYEVAAIVGSEVRGVATFITTGAAPYGLLRVYSNATSGETVTFRFYHKQEAQEEDFQSASLSFESGATKGSATSPACRLDVDEKIAANKAAYEALTALLDQLQAKLDNAVEGIAAEVAGQFTDDIATIQALIDADRQQLEADYEAVALTAGSTIADADAISAAIDKLAADAKEAKDAYDQAQVECIYAQADGTAAQTYTMGGQKVRLTKGSTLRKGIYIINGKKVVHW